MEYISQELKGVIGETYAEPAGRIMVDQGIAPYYAALLEVILDESAYTAETYAAYAVACVKMDAAATEAERVAAYPAVVKAAAALKLVDNTFADAQSGWYKPAVDFAQASGLMAGVGGDKFAPAVTTTRAMVAEVLYEANGAPSVEGLTCPLTDVKAGEWSRMRSSGPTMRASSPAAATAPSARTTPSPVRRWPLCSTAGSAAASP